jgi:hypothetical protein
LFLYTLVVLEEVKSGDWGVAGKTLTTDDVKQLRASDEASCLDAMAHQAL